MHNQDDYDRRSYNAPPSDVYDPRQQEAPQDDYRGPPAGGVPLFSTVPSSVSADCHGSVLFGLGERRVESDATAVRRGVEQSSYLKVMKYHQSV